MNTFAYLVYFLITYIIVVHVGFSFYRNGRIFILLLLQDEKMTDFINRILLTGYYLLNLGYAAVMIHSWKTILTWTDLVTTVGNRIGVILVTLSLIHYCNMAVILLISRRHHHFLKTKT